jgi:hypothetical protein
MLGLGCFLAVFALAFAANDAARAQIAGRRYETNLLYDVLTPGAVARPVEVIAQDPRLEVVPALVEVEVAVPHLSPAVW